MKRIALVVVLAGVAAVGVGCHRSKSAGEGSYTLTCRNVTKTPDGVLRAECLDAHNQYHASSIATAACYTDIANINGVLTCTAPQPTH